MLLTISGLAIFPFSTAGADTGTGATQTSPAVVPTQLAGYKLTGSLAPSASVYVTIGIPLRNLQTLDFLTQQISTPGSPMYDHFLTQAQVEQEFLPVGQYQQALSFLESRGFSIVQSSLDSIIVAQGTAAQVSSLGLSLNVYSNGTENYYSASGTSPLAGVYIDASNVTSVLLGHPTSLVTSSTVSALKASGPSQTNQTVPIEAYPLTDLWNAYNVSSLISSGITGKGYTAGVLDFYGDPYIAQQLQYFDQAYGVSSTTLQVIPIGPYDPSLGPVTGWDGEISLDVESVHAMAPAAAIDLYIANGALPIAAAVAQVVQDDKVNDLSQSWGIDEEAVSQLGPSGLDLNVILTDQFYQLGSAEGITFTAATGDRGGSGASGGPEGTPGYPSTSPYVVSVSGTTTYVDYKGSTVVSSSQTAWSNYGFSPDGANYGGGGSGVSILEPRPWYQSGLSSAPSGFADGRVVPDVSLNANVYPGVLVVFPGNVTEITGGTSESSPLLAGLLTLLMQSSKSSLGLINPSLYSLGESKSLSSKVYTPITFGYNIPWTASAGYNLITGLGAPNIGEMASTGLNAGAAKTLGVNVTLFPGENAGFEVLGGQSIFVSAVVTSGTSQVTTGAFNAVLDTLQGAVASASLKYNSTFKGWTGYLTVPTNASGLSYLTVSGTSGGISGTGFAELFTGYVATYFSPTTSGDYSPLPYSAAFGIQVAVNITTLGGYPVNGGTHSVTFSSYSVETNSYTPFSNVSLTYGAGAYGLMWVGVANGTYPNGPMLISTDDGVYGYLPFIQGVDLQGSYIETSILAEPGVVAPGQSIYILGSLLAPINMPFVISEETGSTVQYDVETGSNLTATLISPSGQVVTTAHIYENDFLTTSLAIQGWFDIPQSASPGLYTLMLNSTFHSFTLNTSVNGSYFAQFYVAPSESIPSISISPSALFQGQSATISAKIDYLNGTAVRYGMYMATVYPTGLHNLYNALTEDIQVPLWYDVSTGLWSGNITLPSAYNGGGTVDIDPGALYLSGPYDVFVTGLSADGVPSTTNSSAQYGFQIQPYLLVSGQTMAYSSQTSGLALSGDTITGGVTFTNDLFTGTNTINGGTVTITNSQINGTLILDNAQLTLVGVTGGTIDAQNSKVTLDQSSVGALSLTGSQVQLNQSNYQQVSPSLPSITFQSPTSGQNFNGGLASFTINGQDVSSVTAYLDGVQVPTTQSGSSYTFQIGGALQDGVHVLQVIAMQQDGLSVSTSLDFTSNAQLTTANNNISTLNTQQASASSTIVSLGSQLSSANASISTLGSKLNSANTNITNLTYALYALGALAVVGVGLGVVAMRKNAPRQPEAAPTPSTTG